MILLWFLVFICIFATTAQQCTHFDGCYKNSGGKIGNTSTLDSANECCQRCTETKTCVSFTWWGNKFCNVFRTISTPESGNCTSGKNNNNVRPNFIFWFPDTVRAESLGKPYGHPISNTSWYTELAANGTAFTQCHVLHTQCAPSRHAMVTGRYMHTTGHRTQTHAVQAAEPNMFKTLKKAGYNVYWFGKGDMLAQDAVNDSLTYWVGSGNPKTDVTNSVAFLRGDLEKRISEAKEAERHTALAAEWLRSGPPEPFFLFVASVGAHPPYKGKGSHPPPFGTAGYYSMYNNGSSIYDPDEIKAKSPLRPAGIENKPRYVKQIPEYRNLTSLDESFFYRLNAVYLEMVKKTSDNFGSIMEALKEQPDVDGRTAVFVSSDHGDFGGDMHLVEKWPGSVDDMLTRVPFIARLPPAMSQYKNAPKGQVVNAPIQLFDIMPTVLEMANISIPFTHFAKSLLGVLTGNTKPDLERTVYSEGGYLYPTEIEPLHGGGGTSINNPKSEYYPRGWNELWNCTLRPGNWSSHPNWDKCWGSPRAVMARNQNYKLVYRVHGVSELYDLAKDSREVNNLFGNPTHLEIQNNMLMHLLRWFVLTSDVTPLHEDPRGLPPSPPKPAPIPTSY